MYLVFSNFLHVSVFKVQCYPCNKCTEEGINLCYNNESENLFSCNTKYPKETQSVCLYTLFSGITSHSFGGRYCANLPNLFSTTFFEIRRFECVMIETKYTLLLHFICYLVLNIVTWSKGWRIRFSNMISLNSQVLGLCNTFIYSI